MKDADMTRTELLERVRNDAAALYGARPVSPAMLRDWTRERLLPGPIPGKGRGRGKGRDWQWSEASYVRALEICRWKSLGVRSVDELRVLQWIGGTEQITAPARASFQKYFMNVQRKLIPPLLANLDPLSQKPLNDNRRARIIMAIGQPAEEISPNGFKYQEAELFAVLNSARSATADGLQSHIEAIVRRWQLPEVDIDEMESDIRSFSQVLGGTLADPDEMENSTIAVLQETSLESFDNAREFLILAPQILNQAAHLHPPLERPLRNIAALIAFRPWHALAFLVVLLFMANQRDHGCAIVKIFRHGLINFDQKKLA